MRGLAGKRIVITGASRGLGRQLALAFARAGVEHIAIIARNSAMLEKTAEEARTAAPRTRILAVAADLGRPDEVERVAAGVLHEFKGRVDALINNASTLGVTPMPLLLDYPVSDFRNVLEVNLMAPYQLTRKLLPAMLEHGGAVINVTSDAGINGYPGWGAYGISKFGLEGMSQTWAAELEGTGIRVNWVDPGSMNTDMHRAAEPDEDPSQWADPADVTPVFLFLASDESSGVTGKRFLAQGDWQALAAAARDG
jgi:NAD(P)-dependent dehydrogenase (short-subunit alcohol dehydrogenase family)